MSYLSHSLRKLLLYLCWKLTEAEQAQPQCPMTNNKLMFYEIFPKRTFDSQKHHLKEGSLSTEIFK